MYHNSQAARRALKTTLERLDTNRFRELILTDFCSRTATLPACSEWTTAANIVELFQRAADDHVLTDDGCTTVRATLLDHGERVCVVARLVEMPGNAAVSRATAGVLVTVSASAATGPVALGRWVPAPVRKAGE